MRESAILSPTLSEIFVQIH